MLSFVPTSRGDWGYLHDGVFVCATVLGGWVAIKMTAPVYSGAGYLLGLLVGIVGIAGHRYGYLPTKLLVGLIAVGFLSVLAFVLLGIFIFMGIDAVALVLLALAFVFVLSYALYLHFRYRSEWFLGSPDR